MEDTKKCPYCAEEIKKEAIFCKHCRSNLNDGENVVTKKPSGGKSGFKKR